MPVRTLGLKWGGFGGGPISIEGRKECQRGRWTLKGCGLWCPRHFPEGVDTRHFETKRPCHVGVRIKTNKCGEIGLIEIDSKKVVKIALVV